MPVISHTRSLSSPAEGQLEVETRRAWRFRALDATHLTPPVHPKHPNAPWTGTWTGLQLACPAPRTASNRTAGYKHTWTERDNGTLDWYSSRRCRVEASSSSRARRASITRACSRSRELQQHNAITLKTNTKRWLAQHVRVLPL